jgi:hypothetical protein
MLMSRVSCPPGAAHVCKRAADLLDQALLARGAGLHRRLVRDVVIDRVRRARLALRREPLVGVDSLAQHRDLGHQRHDHPEQRVDPRVGARHGAPALVHAVPAHRRHRGRTNGCAAHDSGFRPEATYQDL